MDIGFAIVIVSLTALVAVIFGVGLAAEIRGNRRQRAEFDVRVAALGWRKVDAGMVPPWFRSVARRTKLALIDPDGRWYVWQLSSTAFGNRAVATIAVTVPVAFGSPVTPFEVVRRTALGARLAPGVGTGDCAFDRAMLVRSADTGAAEVLGPRLRAALVAGDLPPFRHAGGQVGAQWREGPSIASMVVRVESVQTIAALLRDHA